MQLAIIGGLLALAAGGKAPEWLVPIVVALSGARFTQHRTELKRYHLDALGEALLGAANAGHEEGAQ